ncbi:hypothetical protein BDZ89DRAFT_1171540 [Hymenopellis radicata]|nr:hypothetical protein BDZ89DRAFT_1171540 [Hymenopellis radicata]
MVTSSLVMSADENFGSRVSEALTAYLTNIFRYQYVDLARNGCPPAYPLDRDNLPEQVQYLNRPRIPHESIPPDVYESGIGRNLLTRDPPAYVMGRKETKQFAEAKETAAEFCLITPFQGFELAWGKVFLALIFDRVAKGFMPNGSVPIVHSLCTNRLQSLSPGLPRSSPRSWVPLSLPPL